MHLKILTFKKDMVCIKIHKHLFLFTSRSKKKKQVIQIKLNGALDNKLMLIAFHEKNGRE